jgi:hypothetical protein
MHCFCRNIDDRSNQLAGCLEKVNMLLQEPALVEKKVGRIAAPYF